MSDQGRRRRNLAAALRPDADRPTLALLFNVDEQGHEYTADLLDLAL
ncbi:hypothetical protein O4215_20455 [Rhodococcus maanshanensis]|nr:hypothetical protein [Rhodococcus maanshanensis]MCZ4557936.1 hypothetical protein [Rhodococcus maanshanensis]